MKALLRISILASIVVALALGISAKFHFFGFHKPESAITFDLCKIGVNGRDLDGSLSSSLQGNSASDEFVTHFRILGRSITAIYTQEVGITGLYGNSEVAEKSEKTKTLGKLRREYWALHNVRSSQLSQFQSQIHSFLAETTTSLAHYC